MILFYLRLRLAFLLGLLKWRLSRYERHKSELSKELIIMSQKGDEAKALITELGTDVSEIDADQAKLLARIEELSAGGDGLTAEETDEIIQGMKDLKGRTRATADKVPTP